jgi:phenylacetate-coenzyme A ligase PaaK-like adenylate-forming protein
MVDGVDEWQVLIEKKNDDPHDLDILKVDIAPSEDADHSIVGKKVKDAIIDAIGIPAQVDTGFTSDQLFETMGGSIKVKRMVDKRPKT